MIRSSGYLYLTYSRILVVFCCCYKWIRHLGLLILYFLWLLIGMGVMHGQMTLNPEHLVLLLAGPISHTSIQYMDFVEIFNVSLDLSTIYIIFRTLVGAELPLFIVVIVVTLC